MTRAIRRAAIAVLVVPLVAASGEETTAEPRQLCWGTHATCNARGNLMTLDGVVRLSSPPVPAPKSKPER